MHVYVSDLISLVYVSFGVHSTSLEGLFETFGITRLIAWYTLITFKQLVPTLHRKLNR